MLNYKIMIEPDKTRNSERFVLQSGPNRLDITRTVNWFHRTDNLPEAVAYEVEECRDSIAISQDNEARIVLLRAKIHFCQNYKPTQTKRGIASGVIPAKRRVNLDNIHEVFGNFTTLKGAAK